MHFFQRLEFQLATLWFLITVRGTITVTATERNYHWSIFQCPCSQRFDRKIQDIRKKTFMSQNLCFAWKKIHNKRKAWKPVTRNFSDRNNMQVCQEIGNNNNLRYWSGLFHCCNQICVCMYPAKGGRGAMFCCICDVNHIPRHINHPDVPVMSRCCYLCPSLMDLSLFVSSVISI